MKPLRASFWSSALPLDGCSAVANCAQYEAVTGTPALDGASGCALIACGLLYRAFACPHAVLTPPQAPGRAMAHLQSAAMAVDALRRPTGEALPELSDIVHRAVPGDPGGHVWVRGPLLDGACLYSSIEGGQRNARGEECVLGKFHELWTADGKLFEHVKTRLTDPWEAEVFAVDWWIDLDACAAAWGVAGGAAVPRSH